MNFHEEKLLMDEKLLENEMKDKNNID